MLRKKIRGDEKRPSYSAMVFTLDNIEKLSNRKGWPYALIYKLMYEIKKDLEERNITMKSSEDMIKLKRDDKDWLNL